MSVVEQIQAAMLSGAVTRREIVRVTGLDEALVDATLDILLRTNQIDLHQFKSACGVGGCGNCIESETCTPNPVLQIGRRPSDGTARP